MAESNRPTDEEPTLFEQFVWSTVADGEREFFTKQEMAQDLARVSMALHSESNGLSQ